jgi:hypothetical protein
VVGAPAETALARPAILMDAQSGFSMNIRHLLGRAIVFGGCLAASLYLALPVLDSRNNPVPPSGISHPETEAAGKSVPELHGRKSTRPGGAAVSTGAATFPRSGACAECPRQTEGILQDPSRPLADRLAAGRALIRQGSYAGALAVVRTIHNADLARDLDLREGLIEVLADMQGLDAMAGLAAIVAGDAEGMDFRKLPDDLRAAVQKAIRLNSDGEATGRLLAERYSSQPSPEAKQDLEAIGQPWMFSTLAQSAQANGSPEDTARFVQGLAALDDPRTLDAVGALGERGVIETARAADIAHGWARTHPEQFAQDRYAAALSDPEVGAEAKSVAASALAGAGNGGALTALRKAADHETDPALHAELVAALERAAGRMTGAR